jgi:hypothetical protein
MVRFRTSADRHQAPMNRKQHVHLSIEGLGVDSLGTTSVAKTQSKDNEKHEAGTVAHGS